MGIQEFNLGWVCRECEEFDEKIPQLSREVINRGIDYESLERDEADDSTVKAIIDVMEGYLDCFGELTGDEVEHFIEVICVGCTIVKLVDEGQIEETEDGKYIMREESEQDNSAKTRNI